MNEYNDELKITKYVTNNEENLPIEPVNGVNKPVKKIKIRVKKSVNGVKKLKIEENLPIEIFHFYSRKKDGFELSNFYKMDIQIYDKLFSSGESAFHGMKYYLLSLHSKNQERKIEVEEYGKKFLKYDEFDNLEQSGIKKKVVNLD